MTYRVIWKKAADRAVERLDRPIRERLLKAAEALAQEPYPSGVLKMQGEPRMWRLRVGDYRIVYEIQNDVLVVLVVAIGHRKHVYRGL